MPGHTCEPWRLTEPGHTHHVVGINNAALALATMLISESEYETMRAAILWAYGISPILRRRGTRALGDRSRRLCPRALLSARVG